MKKNEKKFVPRALREVWASKAAVARATRGKSPEAVRKYFHDGLRATAKMIGAKLVKNLDGTYRLV